MAKASSTKLTVKQAREQKRVAKLVAEAQAARNFLDRLGLLTAVPHLTKATGYEPLAWMQTVQNLIKKASGPVLKTGKYKGHSMTNVTQWVRALEGTLEKAMRSRDKALKREGGDGNMRIAAAMGMVLVLWFLRTQRAKAYDPCRPVALRREALRGWVRYVTELQRIIVDESEDHLVFSSQDWDPPFNPQAKSGSYV